MQQEQQPSFLGNNKKYTQTFQEGQWVAEDTEQSRKNRRLKYVQYMENAGKKMLTKETNTKHHDFCNCFVSDCCFSVECISIDLTWHTQNYQKSPFPGKQGLQDGTNKQTDITTYRLNWPRGDSEKCLCYHSQ